MPQRIPLRFELSFDGNTVRAITDKQLNELAKETDAKVLVDIVKGGMDLIKARSRGLDPISDHSKASWSYST